MAGIFRDRQRIVTERLRSATLLATLGAHHAFEDESPATDRARLGRPANAHRGHTYYAEIGRKGGHATKAKHGRAHDAASGLKDVAKPRWAA
jgi:hypothetical protein